MKTHLEALAAVVATTLGTLGALPVQALQTTTIGPVNFSNSAPVVDFEGGETTISSNVSLGTSLLSQFDPSTGVLTGITLNLTSTRTQTTWVTSTDGPNTGINKSVVSSGTGTSNAELVAPGVSNIFSTISLTDTCTASRIGSCTDSAITLATTTDLTVNPSTLDDYVGTGKVTTTRVAPTLEVEQSKNFFTGTESTQYTLTWAGALSLTYQYLLHAAPSFDSNSNNLSLDLNFGTVFLNDSTPVLNFSIFNLLEADRVGLDLDSFDSFGSPFSTTLSAFSSLGPGGFNNYTASMSTASRGRFSTSYKLFLSDADVGTASSRYNDYTMTLNMKGVVIPPPTSVPEIERLMSVPEPDALTLFGIGLAGLGFVRRRKMS